MRRVMITIAAGLLFGGLAQSAVAETVAHVVAAPGPCAEPRVELRGSPVFSDDSDEEIQSSSLSFDPPDDARRRSSPVLLDTGGPSLDPDPGDPKLRPSPVGPTARVGKPPGGGDGSGTPPVSSGVPRGQPQPTPESESPFLISGGPREHFTPQDVAADLNPPRPPRPDPPGFTPRSCDVPSVCTGSLPSVSIISEPGPGTGGQPGTGGSF